ncbi:MAG TPA: hypothetical protein VIL65_07930 [Beijerinckiaceae bacterium]|jgi:hypothetical protein
MAEGRRFERLDGIAVDETRLGPGGWVAVDLGGLGTFLSDRESGPAADRDGQDNVVAFPSRSAPARTLRIPDDDIVPAGESAALMQVVGEDPVAVMPPRPRPNWLRIVLLILLALAIGWNIALRRDQWATVITVPVPDNPQHRLA